ncbi:MAG: PEP-CTERM sorting domain-containing protein [Candidatus Auribacter fodinae]|jgi:probable HAF family extracellular repeat protein|uniref:PEP-CTERM sorting domain-containing protein n=1 Tax=Candidatus Auribacter fodinae TaxID=2093366 RepID=A0A3A4QPD1_9BACT|nr:MAG: PEP-CTERM sorting domain-containing protein [Candidatus Auribacter fodinae]
MRKIIFFLLISILFPCAAYSAAYHIIDLGTLGGTNSKAYAMNDSGHVVGESTNSSGERQAFLWNGTTMINIGAGLGYSDTVATGINNSGVVIFNSMTSPVKSLYYDGTYHDPGINGYTRGINTSGQIAGYTESDQAYRYNGNLTYFSHGRPWAINDSGVMAGYNWEQAAYWDGSQHNIGTLGGTSAWFRAINNSNVMAGAVTNNGTDYTAMYYDGTAHFIGTLADDVKSEVRGINDDGLLVGYSRNALNNSTAFLYEDSTMKDLNDLVDNGTGWYLQDAWDINSFGQIIGYGINPDGETHAFLLTDASQFAVPEPMSIFLLCAGLFGTALRKRMRS